MPKNLNNQSLNNYYFKIVKLTSSTIYSYMQKKPVIRAFSVKILRAGHLVFLLQLRLF